MLIIGGVLSTIGLPAYFVNLGSGRLGWNTVAQVSIGVCNLILGWVMGYFFGGVGVVAAAMIVYVLGHWILLVVVQQRLGVAVNEIIPKIHRTMLLWVALSALAGNFIYLRLKGHTSDLVSTSTSLIIFIVVVMLVVLRHPYSNLIQEKIRDYRTKRQKIKS